PWEETNWENTRIILPDNAPRLWQDLFQEAPRHYESFIPVEEVFAPRPIFFLHGTCPESERGSGILLPVFSLPSEYGVGDLGEAAYQFADFLWHSKQKYWQVLPLNPTLKEKAYSPYSATSGFAGNTLLLSPDLLLAAGLLDEADLASLRVAESPKIDYEAVEIAKNRLFDKVYANFLQQNNRRLEEEYLIFIRQEAYWLEDYALYVVLKRHHHEKPWYEWSPAYRDRQEEALVTFRQAHGEALAREKILQFIFYRQWADLKAYCREREIRIFGDLPIYVNYDSADVWANPQYFSLNEEKQLTSVAGVPPDYFNENGQRWGMPLYRWDVLKRKSVRLVGGPYPQEF
ncbi:MAG: 4-alpha-glucanotransferase, partial [Bacteroidia bacterium]|nr:4-alpha-glucanotransferase [Bacteroidia bacterium]